jgi:hypothetical protein
VYNKFIDEIGMSSTVVAVPSINENSDDRSKKVNQGPDTSQRSTIDCVIVSHSKQVVTLANDMNQVVDRVVPAMASCVLRPVIVKYAIMYNSVFETDLHSGGLRYSEHIENVARDVKKALEKMFSVSQAVDTTRFEIWKVAFTESKNEEMAEDVANFEVKPWDELKAKVWEAVENWANASNAVEAVEAVVRTWRELWGKRQHVIKSPTELMNWFDMAAALVEANKAFNLQVEAVSKAINAAIIATAEATQTWKQANDSISAVSNAKRNLDTQMGQRILSIFQS